MRFITPRSFSCTLVLAVLASAQSDNTTAITNQIIDNAATDGIDLSVLSFANTALAAIADTYSTSNVSNPVVRRSNSRIDTRAATSIIDIHTHVAPAWYKTIVPVTGGNPTPAWDMDTHLAFMASNSITHSIFSFSSPGANVYPGAANKPLTVALARLINEQSAAFAQANPHKLSFYAVVPLPYTAEAITEATYALDTLGAVGLSLYSNHEGLYLGNAQFTPFFKALNARKTKTIIHIHPTTPYLIIDGKYVEANPTLYATGRFEFFFETARVFEDLTLTQTIHNYTNINYIVPHVGGAFPAIIDRMLKSVPALYDASMKIYQTRFWWDSAGPTYFHQVAGILGYGIPITQLLTGTDYPYAAFAPAPALAAIQTYPGLSAADKIAINNGNAQKLFTGVKIWS